QRGESSAAKRLAPATGTAGAVSKHKATHGIGDARLKLLEAGRLPADPLAGNESDVGRLRHCIEQRRDEGGVVLAVAIEGDDDPGARMPDAGRYRCRLAARDIMLDLSQPWAARHQRGQCGLRAVARAIVDVDELEIDVLGEGSGDLVDERRDVVGFVAYRHDHGNSRRGGACKRFAHDLPGTTARRRTCILPRALLM